MYTEIVLALKAAGIQQVIWGWMTGIGVFAFVCFLISWLVRWESEGFRESLVLMILAIVFSAFMATSIVKVTHASFEKNYVVMERVAPIVDQYVKDNENTVVSPTGLLTTTDEIVTTFKEILNRTADLIPTNSRR